MATETKTHSAKATYRREENGDAKRYFLTLSESYDRNNGFICESMPINTPEKRISAKDRAKDEHFSDDLEHFKTIYGIKKLSDGDELHLMHEEDFYKEFPKSGKKEEIAPKRLYIVNPESHQQHIDGTNYKEQVSFVSVKHPEKDGEQLMLFKSFGFEPEDLIDMQRTLRNPEDKAKFIERDDLYHTAVKELNRRLPERMAEQNKATKEYGDGLRQARENKLSMQEIAKDNNARKARKDAIRANIKKSQEKQDYIKEVQPDLLVEEDKKQQAHQDYLETQEPMSAYAHKQEDFTFDPDTQDMDDDFQR